FTAQHRCERVCLARGNPREDGLVSTSHAVGRRLLARHGDAALVDAEQQVLDALAVLEVEADRARSLAQQRVVCVPTQLHEQIRTQVAHVSPFQSLSSARTVIRPARWCVNAAPAQSTTAFARSSFVGRSARCTDAQASWAFTPFIVRPPSIWTTAAPRPIVAI